jgi:hypothetical protein
MIKKLIKILLLLLVIGLIILQFFSIDKANPAIVDTDTANAALSIPDNINAILERSCKDCHSHDTDYPWYSNIQPVGWFLRDHIDHGREHFNLSIYNTYTLKKKAHKLEELCEQVESGEMPLPSYLWLHGEAVLSNEDKATLCEWAKSAKADLDRAIEAETAN